MRLLDAELVLLELRLRHAVRHVHRQRDLLRASLADIRPARAVASRGPLLDAVPDRGLHRRRVEPRGLALLDAPPLLERLVARGQEEGSLEDRTLAAAEVVQVLQDVRQSPHAPPEEA